MANVITAEARRRELTRDTQRQAYHLLHLGFVAAPVLAGLDKFAELLTDGDQYLAPPIARILGGAAHPFMLVVGVVEVVAGLVVAVRPKIGAYVVAASLGGIIVNLLMSGRWFESAVDVADALDIPEETVRTRLHRARGLLREHLAKKLEGSAGEAYSFHLSRCDRVVAAVLARITGGA